MYHGKKKTVGGSVTIFLLIITLSIQMFAGVIIDGARIKLAQAKLDAAVQSALSSSMAYYDADLMIMYDLYGVDGSGDTAQNHYLTYLEANLAGGSDLAKTTVEIDQSNTSLQLFNPYTEGTVFKDAVAETAKYRAPMYLTDDGLEKIFAFVKCIGKDTLTSTDTLAKTQVETETQADDTNSKLAKTTNSELSSNKATVEGEAGSTVKVNLDKVDDSISNVSDAQSSLSVLKQQVDADSDAQSSAQANWTETQANLNSLTDSDTTTPTTPSTPDSASTLALIDKSVTILEVKTGLLSTYKQSVENAYAKYETALATLNALKANDQATDAAVATAQEAMEDAYDELVEATESLDSLLEDTDDAPTMVIASTSSGLASSLFSSVTTVGKAVSQMTAIYDKIQNLVGSFSMSMNDGSTLEISAAGDSPVPTDDNILDSLYSDDDEEGSLDIFVLWAIWDMVSAMLDALVDLANAGIDNLYAISWYKANCTFLTSRDSLLHYFLIGELEYLTFGMDNEGLNIVASVASIFLLRLAVRTVEGLLEKIVATGGTSLAALPALILAALADGVVTAATDMLSMLSETDFGQTGSIEFCSYVPIEMTYSDHLFIILLLQTTMGDVASTLTDGDVNNWVDERMLQCVDATLASRYESTTGIAGSRMDKLYTSGYATAEGSVSFLMLPDSLVSLFAPDALTEDGRYIIRSSAVLEY